MAFNRLETRLKSPIANNAITPSLKTNRRGSNDKIKGHLAVFHKDLSYFKNCLRTYQSGKTTKNRIEMGNIITSKKGGNHCITNNDWGLNLFINFSFINFFLLQYKNSATKSSKLTLIAHKNVEYFYWDIVKVNSLLTFKIAIQKPFKLFHLRHLFCYNFNRINKHLAHLR